MCPYPFSDERPAFRYSHLDFSSDLINDHELASRLPKVSAIPSIQPGPQLFLPLLEGPNGPKVLADYLYTDEPILSLHITSFQDATLVALKWPHTMDVKALSGIVTGWMACLNNQDPPHFIGYRENPLENFGTQPVKEPHPLKGV